MGDGPNSSRGRQAASLVFLACFAVYLAGVMPSPYWLDSAEFAAASFGLGVAHSPGHPLALLVGKAFALLPFGSVAFRVGVASAACTALAAALVTLVAARTCRRARSLVVADAPPDPIADAVLGAAAGMTFGLSGAATLQAVRPEVYGLHAAIVMTATWLLVRCDEEGDRRLLPVAALVVGLGLANHHYLTFAFAAAGAALFIGRARPRGVVWALAAAALGLLVYLYLPLRAARHPEVNWGAPSTLARVIWVVSGRSFHKAFDRQVLEPRGHVGFALADQLGVAILLALLGLYLILRVRGARKSGLLLGGAALTCAAATAAFFDSANPDNLGYLEAAVAHLACLAACAPAALLPLVGRPGIARGAALGLAGAAALLGVTSFPSVARPRFADGERWIAALLDGAPPRALLASSNFQSVFLVWYARAVEGRRPDVDHVHRHFLGQPGYRDEIERAVPSLRAHLGERDLVGLPSLASRRAVLVEPDIDGDPALVPLLLSRGVVDIVLPRPQPRGLLREAEREAEARIDALSRAVDASEPQTRRALFWFHFVDAVRHCRAGRTDLGGRAAARAQALLGDAHDPALDDLAARCRG